MDQWEISKMTLMLPKELEATYVVKTCLLHILSDRDSIAFHE